MQYRILGPLEVAVGDEPVALGPAKERALLGVLLLRANEVVSVSQLIDDLWGESAPASAPKVVQVYVSQLRKRLDGSARLVTRSPGYLLAVDDDDLDALRFERLVRDARALVDAGRTEDAVARFEEALSLWRGPVLADVTFESLAAAESERLDELRLGAAAERIDCLLELGEHERVVGELEALVAASPRRERFREQLMLALYRAGRQADALASYREGRRRLVEELGIEPGPALQELERSILRQDPALALPRTAGPPPTRRRPVLLAAGVALGLAALLALVLRPSGSSLSLEPRSLGLIDAARGEVVAEVALGVRPVAVAANQSTVLVAGDDGTLVRVDPTRERVARTLALDAQPSDLALGLGAAWVADARAPAVLRVDLRHDAIAARVPLPEPGVRAAAFGSLAPRLAFGGGSLWVSHGQSGFLRVRPSTAEVVARIQPARGVNAALAYGYEALWVGASSSLTRVSATTNRPTSSIVLEATPAAIAVGGGAVWVALPAAGKVARVDPETEAVEAIAVGGAPTALGVGRDSLWVAVPSRGSVLRIDPATGDVVGEIRTGATPAALTAAGLAVWVAVR